MAIELSSQPALRSLMWCSSAGKWWCGHLDLWGECNDVIHCEPDADALANRVIMMAGYQGQHLVPAGKTQGVEKFGAAKCFLHNFSLHRTRVVVNDIIWPQQDVDVATLIAARATDFAERRDIASQDPQFDRDFL